MRISDCSSDVCSSDLHRQMLPPSRQHGVGIVIAHHLATRNALRDDAVERATAGLVDMNEGELFVADHHQPERRSEERRVGKEGVRTCSSRWSSYHDKNKLARRQ